VLSFVLVLWYGGAVALNANGVIERVLNDKPGWTASDLVAETLSMERPVLPAPHQVAIDLYSSIVDWPLDSPRNLLYHTAVTAQSTLVGFVLGTLLGVLLAAAIVHSRTLDRALLPWIVASQTVPVLAIAPRPL
jgi:NitT/TauT family transport system permease protein